MVCRTMLFTGGLLVALAAQAQAPAAAAPWALLTIADGGVTVLRGRISFTATEGQRLEPLDIVQTDATARVARLEFGDGVVLDLGPATHVLLHPQGPAWPKERAATAYVAQGWAKLRAARGASPLPDAGLVSATLDASLPEGGVVLAHIEAQAAFAFVESGRAQMVEYRGARSPRVLALGEGHAYSRGEGADTGTAALRPTPAQLSATPRALADSLPRLAGQWSNRAAPAIDAARTVQASEAALWLDGEPALRATLRARWVGPAPIAGSAAKPALYRSTSSHAASRPKLKPPGPLRVATLAPSRLAELTSAAAERIALTDPLPAEGLAVPPSISGQGSWMATSASAPAAKARAQARARVSP